MSAIQRYQEQIKAVVDARVGYVKKLFIDDGLCFVRGNIDGVIGFDNVNEIKHEKKSLPIYTKSRNITSVHLHVNTRTYVCTHVNASNYEPDQDASCAIS